jgi:hypothetical protein
MPEACVVGPFDPVRRLIVTPASRLIVIPVSRLFVMLSAAKSLP